MNKLIIKTIVAGVIVGAIAFFTPKLAIAIFLFFTILRFFSFRRHAYAYCDASHRMHFADFIRSMSDEEYAAFKNKNGEKYRPCRNCHTKTMKCDKCQNK